MRYCDSERVAAHTRVSAVQRVSVATRVSVASQHRDSSIICDLSLTIYSYPSMPTPEQKSDGTRLS